MGSPDTLRQWPTASDRALYNATRAAVLPYLATPSTSERVTLRAGPVIPVAGRAALPARVSLFGNF